jgi:hypothetical protein
MAFCMSSEAISIPWLSCDLPVLLTRARFRGQVPSCSSWCLQLELPGSKAHCVLEMLLVVSLCQPLQWWLSEVMLQWEQQGPDLISQWLIARQGGQWKLLRLKYARAE